MVELQGGSIVIDGVNIRDIGLAVLRERLAFVPQDSTLFVSFYVPTFTRDTKLPTARNPT
jgi:ABC-type transport system involved in Fe-S cluster assembly fused permease/ATPase subunit